MHVLHIFHVDLHFIDKYHIFIDICLSYTQGTQRLCVSPEAMPSQGELITKEVTEESGDLPALLQPTGSQLFFHHSTPRAMEYPLSDSVWQ